MKKLHVSEVLVNVIKQAEKSEHVSIGGFITLVSNKVLPKYYKKCLEYNFHTKELLLQEDNNVTQRNKSYKRMNIS